MPEASDIFEDAMKLVFDEALVEATARPREQDLAYGSSAIAQPANVFASGKLAIDSAMPIRPRLFDETVEADDLTTVSEQVSYPYLLVGKIVSVDSANYVYSARAYSDPNIAVQDQAPQTRPFDPTEITVTLAAAGDPCTLLITPSGTKYLWQTTETYITRLVCE